ncbi:MAG TPA: hypothetical protein VHW66_09345 [Stellaceae bacterium]|nr:hypothetical protein [Stellaceae bacterium]
MTLRPIQTGGGALALNIDEAEAILKVSREAIFQHGDRLIEVRRGPIVASVDHQNVEVRGYRPVELTNMMLRDICTRHIDFQRYDARSKLWVSIDCPEPIAEGIRHRVGKWEFPSLTAIISAPVIRSDGTLIDKSGYDRATGLYVAAIDAVFPKIKTSPTREDALDAYKYLMHPLREVKFADEASESVVAAAILTGLQRPMLDFAPIIAIDSPVAGNGKGMICNFISVIAIGHEASSVTAHEDQRETDKVLGAKLISGSQIILIDNVDHPLSSALLAQMMTESAIDVRMLGQSRNITVPNNFFVLINGNNLALLGDLPRRALKCRLDAGVERPELRVFTSEYPLVVARRDRPMLVAAALTIMVAYRRAGSPPQASAPLGSFNQWSREIRDAILWLGKPDPVETQAAIRSVDRKRSAHEALMVEWFRAKSAPGEPYTVGLTAKRLIELTYEQHTDNGMPAGWRYPELRDALMEIAPHRNGRDIDGQRLGSFLSAKVGQIVGDHRIDRGSKGHGGLVYWVVERVK